MSYVMLMTGTGKCKVLCKLKIYFVHFQPTDRHFADFLSLFTVLFATVIFVVVVLWLEICELVAVEGNLRIAFFLTPAFPSYPEFSVKHKWHLFAISACLMLVSVPVSSLYFVIGHLEKSFLESIM